MISIRPESWDSYYPDCVPLMKQHREELDAEEEGISFNPDLAKSKALCEMQIAQIVTARCDGVMVGYCIFFIDRMLDSADVLSATQGPWFVHRDHRRGTVSYRLFSQSIHLLKGRGVKKAYPHHWLVGDSPKAARIFERFGAKPEELVYSMRIG